MKKFSIQSSIESYFRFIKKFLPEHKADALVGLDIGAGEYKLAEIHLEGEDIHLVNCVVQRYNEKNFAETVKPVFEEIKGPCRFFNTAVNGKGTLIRFLDFPKMTPQEFQQSFAIEADKYFPFPPDQIYIDFHILEENPKTKNMSVIVAAAKREIVDKRLEILKDLKIPVGFMGLHSIALSNAVYALGLNDETFAKGGVALLDMGQNVTTLIVFADRIPRFTRDIYIGGQDMTKRIGNALGLSAEDAEKIKCNPGERLSDVSMAVESVVLNIIQELRLSFDYFGTEKHMEISKLYLTGGASVIAGMDDMFRKNLEIPVERWNVLSSKNLKYDKNKFAHLAAHEPKLGVALGLALYQYGSH